MRLQKTGTLQNGMCQSSNHDFQEGGVVIDVETRFNRVMHA